MAQQFSSLGVRTVEPKSPPYDNARPPSLSLPSAYQLACVTLGAETNVYHCVGASIGTRYSTNGTWLLTFYNTNGYFREYYEFLDDKAKPHVAQGAASF
jgi:hypothetical protein